MVYFSKNFKGFGILPPPLQGIIYAPDLRVQLIRIPHTSQSQRHDSALNACANSEGEGGTRSLDPLKITSYMSKELDPPPPGNSWVPLEHFKRIVIFEIWAVTCNFQQCCILTSVNSDEPMQPPVKLRNSKWCSFSSLTLIEYSSD